MQSDALASPTPAPARPLVLVVDDEPQIRRLLGITLEEGGYRVVHAESGEEGLTQLRRHRPVLVLLDLGLPDLDGLTVLKRVREWTSVPIIILSVDNSDERKVAALDSGADDYVTKPFFSKELLARMKVALRHHHSTAEPAVFQWRGLSVDLAERAVAVDGKPVSLTEKEYALLSYFVRNSGKVLTHGQILRHVWGEAAEGRSLYLRVYMTHLRRKLEAVPSEPKLFLTIPGVGYQLAEPLPLVAALPHVT